MPKRNIIVVDGNYITRKGVVHLLRQLPEHYTVHELESYNELQEAIQLFNADLVLMADNADKLHDYSPHPIPVPAIIGYGNQPPSATTSLNEFCPLTATKEVWLKKINGVVDKSHPAPQETQLSAREQEIVKYIALGYTDREIAEKLFLSTHTVVTHRKNITKKLGIKTVSGLTIYAILNKIIKLEEKK